MISQVMNALVYGCYFSLKPGVFLFVEKKRQLMALADDIDYSVYLRF